MVQALCVLVFCPFDQATRLNLGFGRDHVLSRLRSASQPRSEIRKQCGAQLRGYQSAPQAGAKLATQGRQCRRRRASIESPAERGSTPTYSKSNNAPRSFWEQLRPSRFWLLLKTFFPIRSRHVVSDADVVQVRQLETPVGRICSKLLYTMVKHHFTFRQDACTPLRHGHRGCGAFESVHGRAICASQGRIAHA